MSERLGPLKLGHRHGNPFLGRDLMEDRNYSEEVAKAIDEEVRSIMEACYEKARKLLEENRELMDQIVSVLLVRETIGREEFLALMRGENPSGSAAEADPSGGPGQPRRTLRPRERAPQAAASAHAPNRLNGSGGVNLAQIRKGRAFESGARPFLVVRLITEPSGLPADRIAIGPRSPDARSQPRVRPPRDTLEPVQPAGREMRPPPVPRR